MKFFFLVTANDFGSTKSNSSQSPFLTTSPRSEAGM
jgi:hypothetical protein